MTGMVAGKSFAVGAQGPAFSVGPLTRTDFVRYAGAAEDFNPLHHDDGFAQQAGHRSVFAHGMFSAGLLASFLVKWFGPDCIRRFSVRFKEQVWPGDVLTATGRVIALEDEGDLQLAIVNIALTNRSGVVVVVVGDAAVLVPQMLSSPPD